MPSLRKRPLLNQGEPVDVDALSGALVQIALMEGMMPKVSHAIRLVTLMMAQLRSVTTGDAVLESMETKVPLWSARQLKRWRPWSAT